MDRSASQGKGWPRLFRHAPQAKLADPTTPLLANKDDNKGAVCLSRFSRQLFPESNSVLLCSRDETDHADKANEADDATYCRDLARLDRLHSPKLELHLVAAEDLSRLNLVEAKLTSNLHSAFFGNCSAPC